VQRLAGETKVVGIVNSVGMAHFSPLSSLPPPEITALLNTNLSSLHLLLQLQLDLQSKNLLGDSPFFINVSSAVATKPNPYSAVYSACKAYLSNLLETARMERPTVTFLDVRPWYVKTKMVGYQSTWGSVEPSAIAQGALRVLGKRKHCSGCWQHELIDQFSWLFQPRFRKRAEQQMEKARRVQELLQRRRKK
jgi:short-subunit dehydrogenase